MIIRRGFLGFAILSGAAGCASPGMPPGGPIDTEGPKVIAIAPDSGRVDVRPPAVIFKFDEVVSERPAGVGGLDALFLISPRDGVPNVAWHRSEVAVKPRRGWKSNTAYTITLLPGITDLRGNVRNTGRITIFSTGPEIPRSRVTGTVFNWITGGVAQRALVETRPVNDTTVVYVAAVDSTGRFIFPNLPAGQYRLRGLIDDNNNKGLDPREAWDTTTVALTDSARVELMAFAHDSVAPRLTDVVMRDAATLELLFDRAIDPNQRFTPASIEIKRSDSTVIPVAAVEQGGGRRDSAAVAAGPAPSRPIPSTSLIARLGVAMRQATTIRVRAIGIRSLDGVAKTTEHVATVDPNPPEKTPAPPPPAGATRPTRPPPPPPPPPPPASPARIR
jgi:Big-like domain-containing protein